MQAKTDPCEVREQSVEALLGACQRLARKGPAKLSILSVGKVKGVRSAWSENLQTQGPQPQLCAALGSAKFAYAAFCLSWEERALAVRKCCGLKVHVILVLFGLRRHTTKIRKVSAD